MRPLCIFIAPRLTPLPSRQPRAVRLRGWTPVFSSRGPGSSPRREVSAAVFKVANVAVPSAAFARFASVFGLHSDPLPAMTASHHGSVSRCRQQIHQIDKRRGRL